MSLARASSTHARYSGMSGPAKAAFSLCKGWCSGRDSNPYALRHTPLKRVCLPIPPPEHDRSEGRRTKINPPARVQSQNGPWWNRKHLSYCPPSGAGRIAEALSLPPGTKSRSATPENPLAKKNGPVRLRQGFDGQFSFRFGKKTGGGTWTRTKVDQRSADLQSAAIATMRYPRK